MAFDPGARANLVGLLTNVGLTVLKLVVGVGAGSDALLADAFNSAGDILATAIGAVGYRLAQSPADEDHHYGHGNAESVAGLIIGAMLFGTGLFIALDGGVALWRDESKVPAMSAVKRMQRVHWMQRVMSVATSEPRSSSATTRLRST